MKDLQTISVYDSVQPSFRGVNDHESVLDCAVATDGEEFANWQELILVPFHSRGLALAVTCCALVGLLPAFTARAAVPAKGPYFPVDERVVEDRWHLQRFVVPLARHAANPVVTKEHPWEGGGANVQSVLVDPADGRFKMWYSVWDAYNYEHKLPFSYNVCYAESTDGIEWSKPTLGLFEYQGNRRNNLILLGKNKTQNIDVEFDPRAAAGPRFWRSTMTRVGSFSRRPTTARRSSLSDRRPC
jgi:hypothetical protein